MNTGTAHRYRLFIVGDSPSGKKAHANFLKIRDTLLAREVELEIVDILEEPDRAESDRIIAVPALVRVSPAPTFRIIGDLTDGTKIRTFFSYGTGDPEKRKKRDESV